jgi:hypothetical protein
MAAYGPRSNGFFGGLLDAKALGQLTLLRDCMRIRP